MDGSGVVASRVASLLARARREVDDGVLPSCQVALACDGELVAFETFGDATDDSRYVIWSATKALTGGAVWLLMGEGVLDVCKRVAGYIPEFAHNGKDAVTVDHLLLHTAGFPRAPLAPPQWLTRRGRLEAFASWRVDWEPGSRFEYHGLSAHWVLAELVEKLSGTDYRTFIRERITGPLGLPRFALGVPLAEQGDIRPLELRGRRPTPEEYEAAGMPRPPAMSEGAEAQMRDLFGSPESLELGIPGGGAVGRASDVALYYQTLLHNPHGMWKPDVLADATGTVRNTFADPVKTWVPVNRTRGLVMAGDDGLSHERVNFGKTVSGRTFGHDGAFGQIAWADPVSGLSFCFLTNGMDLDQVRGRTRGMDLSGLAGLCREP